jgi:hypothetical protein
MENKHKQIKYWNFTKTVSIPNKIIYTACLIISS